jgi:ADP-heptose:LPS heptosyltransferase
LAAAGLDHRIQDLGSDFETFTDAAAASHLDLIISPDTAAAHLAGALARPVWLMLPHASEWRWFTDRGDSPCWYPTMRLFRQPAFGDWAGVVAEMAEALEVLAADR